MVKEAIQKITSEMNSNNPYVKVVGQFLIDYINTNNADEAAEKILNKDKTILKSLDAMKNEASKKKVGNCAVLTDAEGFGIVLKYFGIKGNPLPAAAPAVPIVQPVPEPKKGPDFDIRLEDLL